MRSNGGRAVRKKLAPYGTWPSPISSQVMSGQAIKFGHVQGVGVWLYWTEIRPTEGGRGVIMRARSTGRPEELLPPPYSARSRVNEYGGAEFLVVWDLKERSGVDAGERIFFVNDPDQQIYELPLAGRAGPASGPVQLTDHADRRFADLSFDPSSGMLLAVCERMSPAAPAPPINGQVSDRVNRDGPPADLDPRTALIQWRAQSAASREGLQPVGTEDHAAPWSEQSIVSIALQRGARGTVSDLVQGMDFYAAPRLSPDGRMLAFLSWRLPGMPWHKTALYVAERIANGKLTKPRRIAGGRAPAMAQTGDPSGTPTQMRPVDPGDYAVSEPIWTPAGTLLFLADRTDYDNLYAWEPGKRVKALAPRAADFGRPAWQLGTKSYAVSATGQIGVAYLERGEARAGLVDPHSGMLTQLETPLRGLDQVVFHGDGLAGIATRDTAPPALVDVPVKGSVKIIRASSPISVVKGTIARGRLMEIDPQPNADGPLHDRVVYAQYYPPTNIHWAAPRETRPPAILFAHGGPTGAAGRGLALKTQFWTSRGFAVLDVDYSGSTGYGRAYRRRLDGQWGIRDVTDMIGAADYLERSGLADGQKLVIAGSSAGGFTVLAALARSRRFAAGICHYGICDLKSLLAKTHKFESGYPLPLLGLVDLPPSQWDGVLDARSPIATADQIKDPLILFQGRDDKIVPPDQSRRMAHSLTANGVICEYWEFDREGHGFRRARTITTVFDRELAFLTRILKLRQYE